MNSLPTIVHRNGPQNAMEMRKAGKGGKSFTHKVEASSQRRIDQKNRTEEVGLHTQFRFYDVEQRLFNFNLERQEGICKRKLRDYHIKLTGSAEKKESKKSQSALERDKKWALSSFSLDELRSIRRQTRPMDAGAFLTEGMADLRRMETRHKNQYMNSIESIRRLEERVGTTINLMIPRRSYTPPDIVLGPSAIISHFRQSIRIMEANLAKVKAKNAPPPSPAKSVTPRSSKSKASSSVRIEEPPSCTDAPSCKGTDNKPPERKTTIIDADRLRSMGIPNSDINKIPETTFQRYSKVVSNPFGAKMTVNARSRLLLEAQKDDTMYVWLGFKSRAEMMAHLKKGKGPISQIPIVLLDMIEDSDDEDQADLDNFVESDSEREEEDEDPRFQVFDRKKVLSRERRRQDDIDGKRPGTAGTPNSTGGKRPSLGVKKHTVA